MSFFPNNSAPIAQYKNYIRNPKALVDTTGWTTYDDGASATPVNGTGGIPVIDWQRSVTSPLEGPASFVITNSGGDRQGEGVAFDITLDSADQAKVISISFDYEVASGTYATGDLTVYMIADPSGTPVVIQPAGYQIQSMSIGIPNKHIATFQTTAADTSYRFVIHCATATMGACALRFDNFVVSQQIVQYGAPVTDSLTYTPTFTFNVWHVSYLPGL